MDSLSFDDLVPQQDAAEPAQPEPSLSFDDLVPPAKESDSLSILGRSLARGTADAITGVGQSGQILAGDTESLKPEVRPSDDPELDRLLSQPVAEGWSDPNWWIANTMTPLAGSSPTLAGAIGGAGLAGAATRNPYGVAAGGAGGAAAAAVMQTLGPAYVRGLEDGLSADDAFERAWTQAGVSGAFSAVSGALPMFAVAGRTAEGVLKAPIKEALFQMFVAQPGVGVAEQAVQTRIEDKDITADDLAKAYIGEAVAGGVLDVGANLATGGYKTETVSDKGGGEAERAALVGGSLPETETVAPKSDIDPAVAQAVAGAPVEVPVAPKRDALLEIARRRDQRAQGSDNAVPKVGDVLRDGTEVKSVTSVTVGGRKMVAINGKPYSRMVDGQTGETYFAPASTEVTPEVSQPVASPNAAGTEPPTDVGVGSAAPPAPPVQEEAPVAPAEEAPAAEAPAQDDTIERAVAAIQETGVTRPYWLGRMLGIPQSKAADVLLQLAREKRLVEFRNNQFRLLPTEAPATEAPVTGESNPDTNVVPESDATIAEQQKALTEGKRRAVFYPDGTKPAAPPQGTKRIKVQGTGIFDYNPDQVTPKQIREAVKANRLNELLDLGPVNKQEVAESAAAGATPVAVTERTPEGTEVKSAAGTEETAPAQIQALEETKAAPENTVQVEDPRQVIAERQAAPKRKLTPIKQPGEGYRIGQFSFDFNERGGARYVRVRDRSGRNLLQGRDGGAPEVDVTDIWSVADPNQVEKRQGNKVGINSLGNNVPTELVPVFRDYLEGKIDSDEALARISNAEVGGAERQVSQPEVLNAPTQEAPAPKANKAKATSKAREEKAEATPPKRRVLEDLTVQSQKAKQEQAEQNEIIADQIKPFLKGRGKEKTLKDADEKTGKNWTPAERAARRKLNEDSEKVVKEYAPTPEVNRAERDFMDEDATVRKNARAAIRARAEAMLKAADDADISLPEKVYGNTDKSMDLGAGAMNLVIARDFLDALKSPYKDVEEHYMDFLSRDMRLRRELLDEVVSERRTEIDDRMRKGQGGNIEQIAATPVGDTTAEADTEISADTKDVADAKIVGKDDVETKVSRSAKMAPKLDDGTQKGELTVKTEDSEGNVKTKKVVADVAKPASAARTLSAEEKAKVEDQLRAMGLLKRESVGGEESIGSLNDADVLQEVTLADAIAETGESRGNAVNKSIVNRILARIARNSGDTPVKVVDQSTLDEMFPDRPASAVDGFYDPQKDHIVVSANFLKNGQFDAQLLAHEGLHAYLQRAVDSDPTLKRDIQEILDFARDSAPANLKKAYGFKDVQEFLAEAMSNADFQNLLMSIRLPDALASKYDAPSGSVWQALVSAVRKHLGLGRKDVDALSYTMRLVERAEARRGGEQDLIRGMRQRGLLSEGRQKDGVTPILKWLGRKPVADPQTEALFSGTPEKFRKDAQSWKTAGEAADWLIANSRDEATREIIKKIRPAIENSLFSIVKAGDTVPNIIARSLNSGGMGVYWSKFDTNERALYVRDEFLTEEVVAHELLHAATNTRLKEGNLVKNKGTELAKITAEFYDLQRVVASRYNQLVRGKVNPEVTQSLQVLSSVSSVEELATYGLTNAKVREFFKSIPYRGGNVFTEFVDKIRRLFNIPKQDTNALTKIIELTERLVDAEFSQDTRPYASDFLRDINTVGGSITPAMRDYANELKAAGVPDDIAAELDAFINEEMGRAIDPATLPLLMGDFIKSYAAPATSAGNTQGGAPVPPVPPVPGNPPAQSGNPPPATPKGRATWIRNLAIKMNTLDYLRQKYNPFFDGKMDPYIKTVQKYDDIVAKVSEQHDQDGADFLELMRRDPKEATTMANLAMEATSLNVRLGPGADNSHLGKNVKATIQAKQRLGRLNARFDQLKPETRALYKRMIENYRETHNNNIRALAYNLLVDMDLKNRLSNSDLIMLVEKTVNGTLKKEDADIIGEPKIYKELKRATSLRYIKGDYFPQMRFGDFVVLSKDKIADPGITYVTTKGNRRIPIKTTVTDNVVSFKIDSLARGGQAAMNRMIKKYVEGSDLTLLRATKTIVDKQTGKTVKSGEMDLAKDYDISWNLEFQTRGVNFFESRGEAQKFRDDLAKNSGSQLAELSEVLDRRQNAEQFEAKLISGSALTQITKRIDARKDLKPWQRKQMRAAVQEAIVSQMTGNRAQQRHMARRNVKGASKDIARAAITYGQSAGNYYATLTTAGDMRKAFTALEDHEVANQTKAGAGVRSQVMNELRLRHESMMDPLYYNKFLQNVAALSFFDKLVSPAYSIINFQQAIGNGLPYLGGKYGNAKTALAIGRAYTKIGTLDTIAGGVKNTAVAVGQLRRSAIDTTDLIGSIRKKLGPKYEPLVDELIERGLVSPNSGFEIGQAIIDGSGAFNTGIAKFDRIARQLPNSVEAVNRMVVAVAAFDLAVAQKKSVPAAIQEAYDAVSNTQGDYRRSNNPRFMNNRFLSWALQFKKYAVLQTQLVGDMYARALKGATPEDRAIARKQLATLMTVQVMYAGALGLPGLELAKLGFALFAMLGLGDGWEEFEEDIKTLADESIGETWSELLRKGVITRAIGIDVSQRMSQADLWSGFMPDKLDRDGMMQYAGSLLLGAPGSTLFDWFDASRELVDGNVQKALEKLIPIKAVADTMRAVDQVQRGKMTTGEAIVKSIGFQPSRIANISDEIGAEIRESRKVSDERKKLFKEYINASSKGELIKLRAKIREFNRKQGKDGRKLSIRSLERIRRREMGRYSE